MKNFLIIATLLLAGPAFACQMTSAQIVGTGVGAKVNEFGICEIRVEVTEVLSRHPVCPSRVQVGQDIRVKTNLRASRCPKSEVRLRGRISSGGGGYRFSGTIRKI